MKTSDFLKLFRVLPESAKATGKGINPRAGIFVFSVSVALRAF